MLVKLSAGQLASFRLLHIPKMGTIIPASKGDCEFNWIKTRSSGELKGHISTDFLRRGTTENHPNFVMYFQMRDSLRRPAAEVVFLLLSPAKSKLIKDLRIWPYIFIIARIYSSQQSQDTDNRWIWFILEGFIVEILADCDLQFLLLLLLSLSIFTG